MDDLTQSISVIIKKYRGDKSLRKFAAELSAKMPNSISYQTIKNWEGGVTRPAYYFMLAVALHNDDWRRSLALEVVKVLRPELHNPDLTDPDILKGG